MPKPTVAVWVHNLRGVRHQVYAGKSMAEARKAMAAAAGVVELFRLDSTVRLVEMTSMGLEGATLDRRDYHAGFRNTTRPDHSIRLALD